MPTAVGPKDTAEAGQFDEWAVRATDGGDPAFGVDAVGVRAQRQLGGRAGRAGARRATSAG
ncbi:MAG TPA: hypothetical protein VGL88_14620 [Pseudonocardiaceae bacterium]